MSKPLEKCLFRHLQMQQDEVLQSFANEINAKLNNSVVGIVFYGSCMRSRNYKDAMLDFYVIVDQYRHAYSKYWYRIANNVLPPNVFFIQTKVNGCEYRAKYAVMSEKGLLAGVEKAFHSYFWARFTQPISYIYARDEDFKIWLASIQSKAAQSFFSDVISNFEGTPTSEVFWVKGLQLTYASELRAEAKARAALIYKNDDKFYNDVYSVLIAESHVNKKNKYLLHVKWKVRILFGKMLSVLRLMKATTTFVGGVDYIAWKISRHSGEPIVVSEKMRKHPWIYCWPAIFKLIIQGKIR